MNQLAKINLTTRSWWRLKRSRYKITSPLRENQDKENEIYTGMKCVSAVLKICSGKFEWLLPILTLLAKTQFTRTSNLLENFEGYNFS